VVDIGNGYPELDGALVDVFGVGQLIQITGIAVVIEIQWRWRRSCWTPSSICGVELSRETPD
jgi:hypothetical protein